MYWNEKCRSFRVMYMHWFGCEGRADSAEKLTVCFATAVASFRVIVCLCTRKNRKVDGFYVQATMFITHVITFNHT